MNIVLPPYKAEAKKMLNHLLFLWKEDKISVRLERMKKA
jgi:hypothetical protein